MSDNLADAITIPINELFDTVKHDGEVTAFVIRFPLVFSVKDVQSIDWDKTRDKLFINVQLIYQEGIDSAVTYLRNKGLA